MYKETNILVHLSVFVEQKGRELIFTSVKIGKGIQQCKVKRFAELLGEVRNYIFLRGSTSFNFILRPLRIGRPVAIRK